ncbi:TraA family conjugative transfer protein [Paracoccus sp. 1_MG-2023]|uniref:TraA family conjugative transfer protein n=1 Tax=unclassified Paracoccus (in: a-proteobacteria) TaxID=2688777 RepID=UPI001C0881E0|nr:MULTISPECIES: TraA family conjugative transfer protein [unclassified Paracoccus (in: a-proteobacteria)]MBU2959153.1 hypothetical protein [Paracoccus sp. C2R09]MDO6669436.1 TraA family conjugative transfer protein [Paracoccus sp. 1_MG-2023]
MFDTTRKTIKLACVSAVAVIGLQATAHAGTTGTEFQAAYTMLTEWINGYFGRALAIAFLLVGLFMGIARQNLMACGVSIAVAFGLIITPTILDNVLSATMSETTVEIEAPAAVKAPASIGMPSFTAAVPG